MLILSILKMTGRNQSVQPAMAVPLGLTHGKLPPDVRPSRGTPKSLWHVKKIVDNERLPIAKTFAPHNALGVEIPVRQILMESTLEYGDLASFHVVGHRCLPGSIGSGFVQLTFDFVLGFFREDNLECHA